MYMTLLSSRMHWYFPVEDVQILRWVKIRCFTGIVVFDFLLFSGLLVLKQVLEVQLPGKKVTSAAAFWNGLRGQKLKTL